MTTHITGDATCERDRRVPPAGWVSADAYRAYLEDPDGGRAPFRSEGPATFAYPPHSTATGFEADSWDMPAKGDER